MRIGVTSDIDQQRGVVNRRPVPLAEPRLVRQPQRDQALADNVLHRLPEPQVHAQRQRREQLGHPDGRLARTPTPTPTHHPSLARGDLA